MKELEALWSVTEENSDIYAVNHSNGSPATVSDETAEILSFALEMAAETNGALDPTIHPLVSAWGFTTEEHHIPSDDKIQEMLSLVGYEKIRLDENQVQLPPNMMLDLGALGEGICRRHRYSTAEGPRYLVGPGRPRRQHSNHRNEARRHALASWPARSLWW